MQDWEQHFLKQSLHSMLRYPELAGAQQYAIAPEISRFCFDVWRANEEAFSRDSRAVSPCVVPASDLLLFVASPDTHRVLPLHIRTVDGISQIFMLQASRREAAGGFLRSGTVLPFLENLGLDDRRGFGFFVSLLVSVISQPSFVEVSRAGSRQVRRRLEAKFGVSAEHLRKVTWNLGESSARTTGIESGRRMPLHFRRGHWRRAEPHFEGAEWVKDGPAGGTGAWRQWIKAQWPGHPAFGVRISVHAPKINIAGLSGNANNG